MYSEGLVQKSYAWHGNAYDMVMCILLVAQNIYELLGTSASEHDIESLLFIQVRDEIKNVEMTCVH